MRSCFRRALPALLVATLLSGCGNRETTSALRAAKALEDQKQYQDADDVLVKALHAREEQVRAKLPVPADQPAVDELTKKIQSDGEILKMERAQIPIYLHLERPDLASAVYSDIVAGHPDDTVVFETLKDPDASMRIGAVRVLGLTGGSHSIDGLAEATKDSDKEVRRAAVAALGTIKDAKAVPPLIDALKDSYWFVRSDAADALGRERDGRAVEPLIGLIGDPDKTVQSTAESALVLLCSSPGVSGAPLAARLNDSNPTVVVFAAVCLAEQKDPRATPVLLRLATSTDPDTRLHAVRAMGDSGDPAVLPTLRLLMHDSEVNVRGWSIIGLGRLKDAESLTELRTVAADAKQPPEIRAAATAAVDHISGKPIPEAPGNSSP